MVPAQPPSEAKLAPSTIPLFHPRRLNPADLTPPCAFIPPAARFARSLKCYPPRGFGWSKWTTFQVRDEIVVRRRKSKSDSVSDDDAEVKER